MNCAAHGPMLPVTDPTRDTPAWWCVRCHARQQALACPQGVPVRLLARKAWHQVTRHVEGVYPTRAEAAHALVAAAGRGLVDLVLLEEGVTW